MADTTESVKVPTKTMNKYRRWARDEGCFLTFLVTRALENELARRKEASTAAQKETTQS
jgi:hypothetical protein